MIPNPILYNDSTIMITLIVCCLIILAIVMIPKAIRYRKKIKENENIIPNQENQELEMRVIEVSKKSDNKKMLDYKETFMSAPKIVDRQTVFVSRETRDQLVKIARRLGDRKMSVSGFIENMAKHHLEEYREEIERLYKE